MFSAFDKLPNGLLWIPSHSPESSFSSCRLLGINTMTTAQKKITSYCGRTSCTWVEVSASIADRKHVAKTQATLAGAFTNLKTPRKRLSHVQKELVEINLCEDLACAKAQLKKRQDKKAQGWPNNLEVAQDCQKSRINRQKHSSLLLSYLSTSSDKLHLFQKHLRESE